jgi:cytochrome c biogenesis protein CcmG/thiol:disulfide interchange protein DsbE
MAALRWIPRSAGGFLSERRLLVVLVVTGAVAVGGFLGLLLRSSDDSAVPRLHGERLALVPTARRKALPDLRGPALTPPPAEFRLGSLRGRPAFIDVWASWCVPCREEAPLLARLWREHRRQIRFLGIDAEDSRGDARRFIRRYRLGYPNIFDRTASLAGRLGFFGFPTAYLIDGQGRIAAKLVGKQKEATLRAGLKALARQEQAGR